jgi:glycerol-3-phosphate dehydrogenase
MSSEIKFDLFIVGAGINGAAIANQASAAGLKVGLCDQLDLAQGTSGASTKLIHGGLRYLEKFEFSLVREALREQRLLRKRAPHLVHPLEIYMPDAPRLRRPWQIGLGLFIYDWIASSRQLPKARRLTFSTDSSINPLNLSFKKGYAFYDCVTHDCRLVIENCLAAQENNAHLYTRHQCISAERSEKQWKVNLQSDDGAIITINTPILINATGPWSNQFISQKLSLQSQYRLRLVKGSHLVFPKFYEGKQAYLLQNIDGRIIFVIPYLEHFTLVGTTEFPFEGDPQKAHIEPDEIYYLCDAVNRFFHHRFKPRDVIGSWSGVRPLFENNNSTNSDLTRSAKIELEQSDGKAPLINIFGGKLTTHRALADRVLKTIAPIIQTPLKAVRCDEALPGGRIDSQDLNSFVEHVQSIHPWLTDSLLHRYTHTYGQRTLELLEGMTSIEDLGSNAGHGLHLQEVRFLMKTEWARTLDDILMRRTQLGYFFSKADLDKAQQWWNEQGF